MPTQLSKDKRKDKKKKQELLKRVEEYAAAEAAKPDLTLEVDMENNDDTEKDRKTTVMQKETLLTYLDHHTMTGGDGRYLHHFTKPGKAVEDLFDENDEDDESPEHIEENVLREKVKKPAEVVADLIVEWMTNPGVNETLQVIAVDSTNSNTGWKAGAMAWKEASLVGVRATH